MSRPDGRRPALGDRPPGVPPSLLALLYFLNYEYVSVLFKTPIGVKMLSITAVAPVRRRLGDQEDRRDQGMNVMMLSPEISGSRWRFSWRSRWGPGACSGSSPAGRSRPRLRLKRLLDPSRRSRSDQAKRQEQVQAKVAAAANKLGKSLPPSDVQELGKIRLKLLNAGFRHEQASPSTTGSS